MMHKGMLNRLPPFLLYCLSYLLLLEWLIPLQKLDTIRDMNVFLIYIVCTFVLNLIPFRLLWKVLIQFGLICSILYFMYYSTESLLTAGWITPFIEDCIRGIDAVWNQQWKAVPNSFATALFLFLLWSISYLIHYWVIQRKSIFFFFMISILFIAVIDTFTPIDGDRAIVRIFVIGLFVMGCLRFYRLMAFEREGIDGKDLPKWLLPLAGMLALGVTLGFITPKLPAQWKDPVPYIISYSDKFKEGNEAVKKVGYGEDDTKLGGDFLPDNRVVFTVKSKRQHYWLVETKDFYTGKGWEFTGEEMWWEPLNKNEIIPYSDWDIHKTIQFTDVIEVETAYSHVPLPTPIIQGNIDTSNDASFLYNPYARKIMSIDENGEEMKLKQYEVTYSMPVYDLSKLRSISEDEVEIPDSSFLQLPSGFPKRIRMLTEEITKDADNLYDKVKAVEDFFDGSEFVYAHEDIPYPEGNEDFVEHFLFETLRGYCDHFSTSMVVMLRSIGIPAKWVKGYTSGDFVKYEDGHTTYQITNNNAHSWVEVYFPEVGWVPFEPTKGYSNNVQFQDRSRTTSNGDSTSEVTPQEEQTPEERQNVEQQEENKNNAQSTVSFADVIQEFKENGLKTLAAIILGAVISFIVYATRVKWLPYVWFAYFRQSVSEQTFAKAYKVLLKQLERRGLKRGDGQTLREYAKYVDEYFSIHEMSELTMYYEQTLYKEDKSTVQWESVKLLWKNVMRKTIT